MTDNIDVVMKDQKTVQNIIRPMIYVSWLLGAGIARPGEWRKTTIFIRFIHFTMCCVVVAYAIKDFFIFGNVFSSEMFKIMYYMNKAVGYVTSYYYVAFGYVHYKKWPKLMEKIANLDRKLRRETSVNDRLILVNQLIALIAIFIVGPLALVAHVLYYYFTNPKSIYASDILVYYIMMQSLGTNFMYNIIVLIVFQRFKTVNELIRQIGDVHTAPWIVLKVQRLRELHHGICDIVNYMNGIHGTHLLLMSANSFMMVVATLFRIYIGLVDSKLDFIMVNNVIWIVWAIQFALTCNICSITCREASNAGILINEIALKNNQISNKRMYNNVSNRRSLSYHPESKTYEGACVQNEVANFSSQLQQFKVAFSACDYFELNNALLQSFIGVITTYLIILVQFYKSPEKPISASNLNFTNSTANYSGGVTDAL